MKWLKYVPFLHLGPNRSVPCPPPERRTRNGGKKISIKIDTSSTKPRDKVSFPHVPCIDVQGPAILRSEKRLKGITDGMKAVASTGIKVSDYDNLYSYTTTTTIFKPRKKHRLTLKRRQRDYPSLVARNVNAQIEYLRRDLGL